VLDIEERSEVMVLRLRHGKVNALDLELLEAISAALRDADNTDMVITGAASVFSAGVDLHRIVDGGTPYVQEFLPALAEVFMTIFDHSGPVVAAINGHAIAGGCVIAAACDLRVMSQGKIGLAELNVGVPFPTSAMEIMRHAIGPAVGQLVLTASLLDAPQARSIGLVNHIEEPENLLDSAVRRVQEMARIPAEVFAFSKRQLQQPARERIAARSGEDETVRAMWCSNRTRETISECLHTLQGCPR
jgi:enoyl-CoA hydratase